MFYSLHDNRRHGAISDRRTSSREPCDTGSLATPGSLQHHETEDATPQPRSSTASRTMQHETFLLVSNSGDLTPSWTDLSVMPRRFAAPDTDIARSATMAKSSRKAGSSTTAGGAGTIAVQDRYRQPCFGLIKFSDDGFFTLTIASCAGRRISLHRSADKRTWLHSSWTSSIPVLLWRRT